MTINNVSVEGQGFQNPEEGPAGFTADELPTVAQPRVGPPLMKAWTRDGFSGSFSVEQPMSYAPDYISAKGPHAPRRFVLSKMKPSDETNADALPSLIAASKLGVRISVSGRRKRMAFVVRNIEADELHFIQDGEVKFETDVGVIVGRRGDFVCIPRAIAYRFAPTTPSMRSFIVECPSAPIFATPYAVGTINFDRDLELAKIEPAESPGGQTKLLLKSADEEHTTFMLPHDPLAMKQHLAGKAPVWRINLANIQKVTSLPEGGPPYPFLSSKDGELIAMNMGSRPTDKYRPPIHLNADYDELLLYVDGPGTWGGCTEPGTLTWVPKGVLHHGVPPFSEQGYSSWLLETRATFRWTAEALATSGPMETGTYGPQPQLTVALGQPARRLLRSRSDRSAHGLNGNHKQNGARRYKRKFRTYCLRNRAAGKREIPGS